MPARSREAKPPRAVIHRRILDEASTEPDASLGRIADSVSGASVDLVERVLDEYGDPAQAEAEPPTTGESPMKEEPTNQPSTDTEDAPPASNPAIDDLSGKVRQTLEAIYEQPEASQQEIADRLDVCAATISTRLSSLEGFDWYDRRAFVEELFGKEAVTNGSGQPEAGAVDLEARVADLERAITEPPEQEVIGVNPELAHKVIHVCMASDDLTEEEELELIAAITS